MSRRPAASTAEPSYDSFLDIVANLVGILVILIMVLGVRAKDAYQHADSVPSAPVVAASVVMASVVAAPVVASSKLTTPAVTARTPAPAVKAVTAAAVKVSGGDERESLPDVDTPRQQAAGIRAQLFELDAQTKRLSDELAIQRQSRSELQLQVRLAEQELAGAERRAMADEGIRTQDPAAEMAAMERDRQQLRQQIAVLEIAAGAPTVLRNEPTPLSRPVDGYEIHLRLLGGRVAYVPISESVARLGQVVAKTVWRLKNSYEVKAQLEPRDGFVMHYTLVRQLGPGGREAPALGGFEMIPQADPLGEPFATAVGPNSELAGRLSDYDPRGTTVTVWTYPDSFSYFRDLKTYLLDRGFQVAARPLPSGYPIGGSPQGSKSAAQ